MFEPISLSHDETVRLALRARDGVSQQSVVKAFVASLTSRRLDLRSGLGSYAVARHLTEHPFTEYPGNRACRICGTYPTPAPIDLNVLSFERHKWGGVRHDQLDYIGFDLSQLRLVEEVEPNAADYLTLKSILATARNMPPSARLKDLSKAMAAILPSNDAERRTLIAILGYCGILIDQTKPDFRMSFVPLDHRMHTNYAKDDWPYPVQWWNATLGVNEDAVVDWFPDQSI